jgi:hypothetical protein
MPRKPKQVKRTVAVVVNGNPVTVTLHPPAGARKSWYAYWAGLVTSRSTGQREFEGAVKVVEGMLRNGGDRPTVASGGLTDEEFEQIQRTHFARKQDPAEQARAQKSLTVCLEAIRAFKAIAAMEPTGFVQPLASADADVCAAFQRAALRVPKNWRQNYLKGRKPEEVERLSPNTVLKWSRALQAAFERANRNAGKKCVRGVVPEAKLLTANPWDQFDWIEGRSRPIRQFDAAEITSLLDYLETSWAGVTVAPLIAKAFLWSCCRQQEVAGLCWHSLRRVGDEVHFEVVGKWGVERWFRIPVGLYQELEAIRTDSPFVFAASNEQLRRFHQGSDRPDNARRVGTEFKPQCLGDWFADRIDDWSAALPRGPAHTHVFRKTGLQYVRRGEDINRQVAGDARVSESVLMTSYVKETDEEMRQSSNRTFARILASFPAALARRCGQAEQRQGDLEERLRKAVEAKDWQAAAELTARLARQSLSPAG